MTARGGGGDSHTEWTGMLVGNFEFNPQKETNPSVAGAYADP